MTRSLPRALDRLGEITSRIPVAGPALFLDYDGTLSALQPRPELAVLDDEVRQTLQRLASRCFLAIVSGRDRAVVEELVGLPGIYYAGSHGFDISGPGGLAWEQAEGARSRAGLSLASRQLEHALQGVDGAWVEPKRYATSVHFRQVEDALRPRVEKLVRGVARDHADLRVTEGKCVLELRPDVDWHKGHAMLWLIEHQKLEATLPIFIGDDITDEDALRMVESRGVGIRVGDAGVATAARYRLDDVRGVHRFLDALLEVLSPS